MGLVEHRAGTYLIWTVISWGLVTGLVKALTNLACKKVTQRHAMLAFPASGEPSHWSSGATGGLARWKQKWEPMQELVSHWYLLQSCPIVKLFNKFEFYFLNCLVKTIVLTYNKGHKCKNRLNNSHSQCQTTLSFWLKTCETS